MQDEFLLTQEALEELEQKLEVYKRKRRQIAIRIQKSKEFGDLSENAEYSEAKEAQALNEAEVAELENIVKNSVIVSKPSKGTRNKIVQIGSKIKVKTGALEKNLIIVSPNQVDPQQGKISHESPLGKALIDHCNGEIIQVETPNGPVKYKILGIS